MRSVLLGVRKKLHEAGHILSEWDQWCGALRAEVETEKGKGSLIPDGRFRIDDEHPCYLAIVKSYESEYENGESNVEHKIFPYNEYWHQSGDEFRVLFVMPTKARVARFLAEIERLPYRRFWFTDEESYRATVLGKIWGRRAISGMRPIQWGKRCTMARFGE
jgi:hypothetical protein